MTTHTFDVATAWSGSTDDYATYDRTHRVTTAGGELELSADAAFLGNPERPNPELLLVAAASSCQLLSFLAVAARSGVEVLDYRDDARGLMPEDEHPVRITRITLRPVVTVRGADPPRVERLLHKAHEQCYIANSLTARIELDPRIDVVG